MEDRLLYRFDVTWYLDGSKESHSVFISAKSWNGAVAQMIELYGDDEVECFNGYVYDSPVLTTTPEFADKIVDNMI